MDAACDDGKGKVFRIWQNYGEAQRKASAIAKIHACSGEVPSLLCDANIFPFLKSLKMLSSATTAVWLLCAREEAEKW
jgi:hypothetical protein